jgi:hypothetical protein
MTEPASILEGLGLTEPLLWVALDAGLGVLIGREVTRTLRQRQARLAKIARARAAVQSLLDISSRFIADGHLREAVLHAYPALLAEVRQRFALAPSPASTHRELLQGWRGALPEAVHGLMSSVYQFYEPVRYGEWTPAAQDIPVFRGSLERVAQVLRPRGTAN